MKARLILALGALAVAACSTADGNEAGWTPVTGGPLDGAPRTAPETQTDVARWTPPVSREADGPADRMPRDASLVSLIESRLGRDLPAGDRRSVRIAFDEALAATRPGTRVAWRGEGSKNRGEIVVARRFEPGDGRVCRDLDHRHHVFARALRGDLTVCRRPNGRWSVTDATWTVVGDDFADRASPAGGRPAGAVDGAGEATPIHRIPPASDPGGGDAPPGTWRRIPE